MSNIHTMSFSDIRNHFLPKIMAQYSHTSEPNTLTLRNLQHSITDAENNIELSNRVINDGSLWKNDTDAQIQLKIMEIATLYRCAEKTRKDKLSKYKTSIMGIKVGLGFLTISGVSCVSARLAPNFLYLPESLKPKISISSPPIRHLPSGKNIAGVFVQSFSEALISGIAKGIGKGIAEGITVILLYIIIPAIVGVAIITFSMLFGSYHAYIHWNDHIKTQNQLKDLRFSELMNQCKID